MRILFILLVLANVGVFAYAALARNESGESAFANQQLNPEKIKVLTPREAAALAAKRPPDPPPAPPVPEPPKMLACLEWGGFGPSDSERAGEALAPFALGTKLGQRKVEESVGYWVYIPPLANRQLANQKAGELKRLGVDEYFIVPAEDPNYRLAISLGVFKNEDAARGRLQQLRKKGVRSAIIGVRETQLSKIFFQMRDVPDTLTAKLNEMKASFPGSEVKNCTADEAKPAG
jgi:hypothetical protein